LLDSIFGSMQVGIDFHILFNAHWNQCAYSHFSVGLLPRETSKQDVKYSKVIAAANGKHDYNGKEMEERRNRQISLGQICKVCSTHKSGETFQRILLPFSQLWK